MHVRARVYEREREGLGGGGGGVRVYECMSGRSTSELACRCTCNEMATVAMCTPSV